VKAETTRGRVFLVGAGPGDPKLITLRGFEAIRKADVVVYDRLASPKLLRHMRPDAEKVFVGKLPDKHMMKQEDINRLLVDLAAQGKTVTRLKGGDPYVFVRVGARLRRSGGACGRRRRFRNHTRRHVGHRGSRICGHPGHSPGFHVIVLYRDRT
jgi:hypothetical protein